MSRTPDTESNEPIILTDLEQRALDSINALLRREIKLTQFEEVLDYRKEVYWEDFTADNHPPALALEVPLVPTLVGKEGLKIMMVPQGFAALARLDENTALVTEGLLTCHGYAMRFATQDGSSPNLFAINHFTYSHPLISVMEFVSKQPSIKLQELECVLPNDTANIDIPRIRNSMELDAGKISQPTSPFIHSYALEAGIIITKDGGVIVAKRSSFEKTVQYIPKARWNWKR